MDRNEHLESLHEIRSMMDRSSRFTSLSGASGVLTGLFALAGIGLLYSRFHIGFGDDPYQLALDAQGNYRSDFLRFAAADAVIVLVLSLLTGILLTHRNAVRDGRRLMDRTARRLAAHLLIPVTAGALFCLILLKDHYLPLIAPVSLLFYGMALINASKYTLNDIRYLGSLDIGLGLLAALFPASGLLLWACGFGLLHIIYGLVMYFKYERR